MTTSTSTDTTDLTHLEFTPACQNGDCDQQPTWNVWLNHAVAACGITVYLCDRCKAIAQHLYTVDLALGGACCPRCGTTIRPPLSNVFRAEPIHA